MALPLAGFLVAGLFALPLLTGRGRKRGGRAAPSRGTPDRSSLAPQALTIGEEGDRGSTSWIDTTPDDGDTVAGWYCDDPDWAQLFDASLGWPYIWAGGTPRTPWRDGARLGVDCVGYSIMALVEAGIYPENWPDLNTTALDYCSVEVPLGSQRAGDHVMYDGHSMMCASGPVPELGGHSWIQGASGGGRDIRTPTPGKEVKRRAATYRGDLLGSGYARFDLDTARAWLTKRGHKLPDPRFRTPFSDVRPGVSRA